MMTCHVVDAKPALGIAFICGEAEEPALCHFCGQPAAYLCDWKVERAVRILASDLRIGDTVMIGKRKARVVYHAVSGGQVFTALDDGKQVVQTRCDAEGQLAGSFDVQREATCDQPCCYFCAREPGDDVHHCMDHWPEIGRAAA